MEAKRGRASVAHDYIARARTRSQAGIRAGRNDGRLGRTAYRLVVEVAVFWLAHRERNHEASSDFAVLRYHIAAGRTRQPARECEPEPGPV